MLHLLGSPQFEHQGRTVAVAAVKPLMLLAYLACKDEWVRRDELAERIWPEADMRTRLSRFRQMLHYLREQGWCPDLEVEPLQVRWTTGSDVHELKKTYAHGHWQATTRQYRGALLALLNPDEHEPYGRWLISERQKLRSLWLDSARRSAAELDQQGRITEAMDLWETILYEDALAEDALIEVLRLGLKYRQFGRGFAAYTAFQQRLWNEYQLPPKPSTQKLLDRLRQSAAEVAVIVEGPGTALPPLSQEPLNTVFVGRGAELAELVNWLEAEGGGVLTVCGPGGVGKTRLVLEALRQSECPSVLVMLISLLKGQSLLAAVAQAMGKPLRSVQTAEEELKALLRGARLALVLDNAEHLMEEVKALAALLQGFDGVKLLITSRWRLGLADERVMELGGLSLEASSLEAGAAQAPALSLLLQVIRRARPGFVGSAYEAEVALAICRSLDGIPLALELAGGWARLFSLNEIAARLEQNLDFLEGSLDISERHRGLRRVFAHSWQLLAEGERKVLSALSLFEGGFEVEAALEVTQANPLEMLALVDKAMIKIEGERVRRGDVHPLVREYAREKLTPNQREQTLGRHAGYFLRFAQDVINKLRGPQQRVWAERLQQELPNLRLALHWWISQEGHVEDALKLASELNGFWIRQGHYREGLDWLGRALALPGANQYPHVYTEALRCAGALCNQLGEFSRSKELLQEALDLSQQLSDRAGLARILCDLGILTRYQGSSDGSQVHLEKAVSYFEQSIATHRPLGNTIWLVHSITNLATTLLSMNCYEQALPLLEECLTLSQALGDQLGMAYAYNNLANVLHELGRPLAETAPLYQESLTIKHQLGDLEGVAITLINLGEDAREAGDLASARTHYLEALSLFGKLNHRVRIAGALATLAQLLHDEGRLERAITLAGFVQHQAKAWGFSLRKFQEDNLTAIVSKANEILGAERAAVAEATGQTLNLEQARKLVE